ncbi:hypothetical protein [Mammaliicoccus sciuri]|uniref:hypothetical protein n=1 Tax=Mammaliicoccus sciuri TaxID=1296 RepID=UPI002737B06F|nr:hypothetical protein [Mammaliicoccus sciuri]
MNEQKDILQFPNDRQQIDLSELRQAIGFELPLDYNEKTEVTNMSEFISRKEFEQYEKRIDDKFDTLNSKIDNLPNILEDKIEKHVNSAKLQLIIWIVGTSIASGGVLIALLTFIAKLIGLF